MKFKTRETLAKPSSFLALSLVFVLVFVLLSMARAGENPLSQESLDELKAKIESIQAAPPPEKTRAEIETALAACEKELSNVKGATDDDDEL